MAYAVMKHIHFYGASTALVDIAISGAWIISLKVSVNKNLKVFLYSRGTKQFDDFWVFVEKYQNFQKKRNKTSCKWIEDNLKKSISLYAM